MDATGNRPPNRLKRRLAAGEVCLGATLTMASPVVAELFSRVGFDWLWLEMEHTTTSDAEVLAMLQATNGAETSTVVRVPWNDKTMIKRVLDTGPDAVLLPLVNSAEEAEAAVRAVKYPPLGERGAGLGRAQCYGLRMGEYLQSANDEIMTLVMIEHVRAVENIEAILAVPGIDAVMVGALDLSGSMGILGQTADPRVEDAIQTVLKATLAAGKPCGIITTSADQANRRLKEGFTLLIVGIDILFLLGGATGVLGQIERPPAKA
ncbi:HpcH/HpaI aldolase family protein [Pararhodospirillum photometricum]|uniref:2,4-dihydroxyhept-2-ene-1,7-dioic acid aldolase n=1 Tax=Pararhodospirillum photometricum DSM 122 TaxID=1150469 RepID=H6SLY2_PARPM|nr:aldolase/citrate lyase family protein [Pararhodospirillum photometricum]CCG08997.1 2,4-dihydroxyhept-2-ene-1,7-dioic acid aldolase [Pararhodospirillum photometricum DSM 122]